MNDPQPKPPETLNWLAELGRDAPQVSSPVSLLVFVNHPRCPACGSADIQTRRSKQNGDGSVTRNTLCRACETKFKVIAE